jgi:imidazolonepropionase-like amidohydrolase
MSVSVRQARRPMRALVLLLALGATLPAGLARAASLVLSGGTVWTALDAPPIANGVVVVTDGRITAVGPLGQVAIPAGATLISTEGMTVLPGLVDTAVQSWRLGHGNPARADATLVPLASRVVVPLAVQAQLQAGVTSVREAGTPASTAVQLRERIRAQRLPGPRMVVGGPILVRDSGTGEGGWRWTVRDRKDALAKVQRLDRLGVDQILLAAPEDWPVADLVAVVEEAHRLGRPVWAEVKWASGVAPALAAGVDGFIGLGLDSTPDWPADALAAVRSRAAAGRPVWWSVQLAGVANHEALRLDAEPLDDPAVFSALPPVLAQDLRASWTPYSRVQGPQLAALRLPVQGVRTRALRDAGARIVVGSGAGQAALPHARSARVELEALVRQAGFTPAQALRAGTADAAQALGLTGQGHLAVGESADVIAVRGALLADIGRLQDVAVVIAAGRRVR